jgi:hypothetical protein
MKSAYMVDPMTRALLTMDVDPNIWNTGKFSFFLL